MATANNVIVCFFQKGFDEFVGILAGNTDKRTGIINSCACAGSGSGNSCKMSEKLAQSGGNVCLRESDVINITSESYSKARGVQNFDHLDLYFLDLIQTRLEAFAKQRKESTPFFLFAVEFSKQTRTPT